ncbi:MAG: hypothetical protein AAFV29_03595 [Myxococcota bacterium]
MSCGGVPLVDELPQVEQLTAEAADRAVPVGLARGAEDQQLVEIQDQVVDLLRVFPLMRAKDLQAELSRASLASLIVPVPITFPDMTARFELRVLPADHEAAEAHLRHVWSAGGEGQVDASDTALDQCPACGADVPLNVDVCPECELFLGAAEPAEQNAET